MKYLISFFTLFFIVSLSPMEKIPAEFISVITCDSWEFAIPLEQAQKLAPVRNYLEYNPKLESVNFRFINAETFLPIYNHLMRFEVAPSVHYLTTDQFNKLRDAALFLEYWPILALLNRYILKEEIAQGVEHVTILSSNPDYLYLLSRRINYLLERIPYTKNQFGYLELQKIFSTYNPSQFHTIYSRPKKGSNNELLQQLIPFLDRFTSLRTLDLSHCQCSSFSDVICGLTGLVSLNLSDNGISEIPGSISALTALKHLTINDNGLSSIPSEIGHLTNLETLLLKNNRIDVLPDAIRYLSHLCWLDLSGNLLTTLPSMISSLCRLENLYLKNNQLDKIPGDLCELSHLITLNLSTNNISSIPEDISGLHNLKTLELSHNQLIFVPPSLYRLSKLMYLGLLNNKLHYISDGINALTALCELNLTTNQLRVLNPELYRLPKLRDLKFTNNPVCKRKRPRYH